MSHFTVGCHKVIELSDNLFIHKKITPDGNTLAEVNGENTYTVDHVNCYINGVKRGCANSRVMLFSTCYFLDYSLYSYETHFRLASIQPGLELFVDENVIVYRDGSGLGHVLNTSTLEITEFAENEVVIPSSYGNAVICRVEDNTITLPSGQSYPYNDNTHLYEGGDIIYTFEQNVFQLIRYFGYEGILPTIRVDKVNRCQDTNIYYINGYFVVFNCSKVYIDNYDVYSVSATNTELVNTYMFTLVRNHSVTKRALNDN